MGDCPPGFVQQGLAGQECSVLLLWLLFLQLMVTRETLHWVAVQTMEGLMMKLKLQYFGYLMRRTDIGKTLMLGGIEDARRRE